MAPRWQPLRAPLGWQQPWTLQPRCIRPAGRHRGVQPPQFSYRCSELPHRLHHRRAVRHKGCVACCNCHGFSSCGVPHNSNGDAGFNRCLAAAAEHGVGHLHARCKGAARSHQQQRSILQDRSRPRCRRLGLRRRCGSCGGSVRQSSPVRHGHASSGADCRWLRQQIWIQSRRGTGCRQGGIFNQAGADGCAAAVGMGVRPRGAAAGGRRRHQQRRLRYAEATVHSRVARCHIVACIRCCMCLTESHDRGDAAPP